ncbi:MAG: lysozyme, partial [Nitrospinae bacterium]|nr:lysozyme [Nitrospinota bacterium]
MEREESVDRSLEEITMDIQWNLRKLSAALDRYYGQEPFAPQRALDIADYPGPASKANFDPAQPRGDQGRWTDGNNDGDSQGRHKPAREKPKPAKDHVTSGQGVDFLKRREQFRDHVYEDEAGKRTIGWGHLLLPGEEFPDGITKEQALRLLAQDMRIAETAIQRKVKVGLVQHQFDALTSLVFNIGGGAFENSTLLRLLNREEYNKAA